MVSTKEKRNPPEISLQHAFESTFHQKYKFDDFLNLDMKVESDSYISNNRTVHTTSAKLKNYLRFLNNFVFDHADINPLVVHSYRKGKSTYTAVLEHANSKYFFKTDIKHFFYSISKENVEKVLKINLDHVPISDLEKYKEKILDLITVDGVLPVGFSTSPSITNTVLFNFDNNLLRYCISKNLVYTRYSDDIIISSNSKESIKNIQNIISDYLYEYSESKFIINEHKTKFTHIGNKVKLLGMVVLPTGKISVDSTLKKEIEALLYFYSVDDGKYNNLLQKNFKSSVSCVSGKLNYINTIDSTYLDKLRKKYGNFIVDYFYGGAED